MAESAEIKDYDVNSTEAVAMPAMGKEELYDYALTKFKVKLDMRKSIDVLTAEVAKLEKPAQAKQRPKSTHLLNTENNRVFDYTDALAALDHMKPCDKDGKPV